MKRLLFTIISFLCIFSGNYVYSFTESIEETLYGRPSDFWDENALEWFNNLGLNPNQKVFLMEELLPILGRRLFSDGRSFRPITVTDTTLTIGFSDGDINIEWVYKHDHKDYITFKVGTSDEVILRNEYKELHKRALIQKALIGHSLHPYITSEESINERKALFEPVLFLRPGQAELIRAVNVSFDAGQKKALVVAPTGIGKTAVKLSILSHLLQTSPGLYIIVADTIGLV